MNVGLATVAARAAANPLMGIAPNNDPDLLPGAIDVSSPDSNDSEVVARVTSGTRFFEVGRRVRNYGAFLDLSLYNSEAGPLLIPLNATPYASGVVQAFPANAALVPNTDRYYRGFDQSYPDYWRYQEWQREFAQFVTNGDLPALEIVRLAHDHTGNYGTAVAGVNTVRS